MCLVVEDRGLRSDTRIPTILGSFCEDRVFPGVALGAQISLRILLPLSLPPLLPSLYPFLPLPPTFIFSFFPFPTPFAFYSVPSFMSLYPFFLPSLLPLSPRCFSSSSLKLLIMLPLRQSPSTLLLYLRALPDWPLPPTRCFQPFS